MERSQSNKLKNLKVVSVDLCGQGANPDADVSLYKSIDEPQAESKVQKLLHMLGKLLGTEKVSELAKEAELYSEVTEEVLNRHVQEEIWDYVDALRISFQSILADSELDAESRLTMLNQSIQQFTTSVSAAVTTWANGGTVRKTEDKSQTDRLNRLKTARDELDRLITEAEPPRKTEKTMKKDGSGEPGAAKKGVSEEMKFDKSKMSPEDLSAFEEMEKKYGVEDVGGGSAEPPAAEPTQKSVDGEFKKAMEKIDELTKRLELNEMVNQAKKYEPLGEKPEELAKTLLTMKSVNDETYMAFIKRLDDSLALVENGLFKEYGNSRPGGSGSASAKLDASAKELCKADSKLSYEAAFTKAYEENPALAAEYEQERS